MITIFTPTYNREQTLTKLFESLKKQTDKKFEWIIVDDESTDNTEKLVNSFISENCEFNIYYKKQNHGGKHRAINRAVKIAKYDWFFIVDSDDYLSNDAVEKLEKWIQENKNDEKIGIISASRFDVIQKKQLATPDFLFFNAGFKCFNYKRSDFFLDGDRAEIYRTDILRQNPFPEYKNEYFITEDVCWNSIAKAGFYTVFYPDVIYFNEYREDGLTKTGANKYKGAFYNFNGFLESLKIRFQVNGICPQFFTDLMMAFKIASIKKINLEQLADRLEISIRKLKKIKFLSFKFFLFRIFRKLMKICDISKDEN